MPMSNLAMKAGNPAILAPVVWFYERPSVQGSQEESNRVGRDPKKHPFGVGRGAV